MPTCIVLSIPPPIPSSIPPSILLDPARRRYRAPRPSQFQLQCILLSSNLFHSSKLFYPRPPNSSSVSIQIQFRFRPRTYPSPPIVPDAQNHSRNLLASDSEDPWPRTPSINASKSDSESSSHSRPRSHNHDRKPILSIAFQHQLYMLRPSLPFLSRALLFCSVARPFLPSLCCLHACLHRISFISRAVRLCNFRAPTSKLFIYCNIPPAAGPIPILHTPSIPPRQGAPPRLPYLPYATTILRPFPIPFLTRMYSIMLDCLPASFEFFARPPTPASSVSISISISISTRMQIQVQFRLQLRVHPSESTHPRRAEPFSVLNLTVRR
ncbi:hypothetical protein B0H13DRAFT_2525355 [Mycena leptocephala]|nr:hypothetical protein B0H13DRAFT_2525355 [Mycena leptocephala]